MRRLASYELLHRLGSGGMAEVWMGRRVAGEGVYKAVAIKVLPTPRAADERYRRMFQEEARLSLLLSHSNIVQVFDVGQSEGQSYLVMEWVDGLNLAQLAELTRSRHIAVPDGITAFIIGELLQALAYAHTLTHEGRPLAIIHRDVSPQNVLISVSGEVKLADFGIARVAHDDTSGLFVKGKLRYMAPEQLAGQSRSPAVDLFAVGAILHELLDGARFRDGDDEAAILAQVHRGEVPPLRRRGVPRELEELRQALLRPSPDERLASAERALEHLRRWPGYRSESLALGRLARICVGVGAPRSGVTTAPLVLAPSMPALGPAGGERGRRRPWAAIGGGVSALTLALILGSLFLDRRSSGPEPEGVPGAPAPRQVVPGAAPEASSPASEAASPALAEPSPPHVASIAEAGRSPSSPPESGPVARPRPEEPRARAPARVHLKAGSYLFVYVQLRQGDEVVQSLVLEPLKEIELAPGRYQVAIRERASDPWRPLGDLRVRSGGAYDVRMGPSEIIVRELEG